MKKYLFTFFIAILFLIPISEVLALNYPLTVFRAGDGDGQVWSANDNNGIICPGDCSQSYLGGTEVRLDAWPLPGSIFTGWSVGFSACGNGTNSDTYCIVTVRGPETKVIAFFNRPVLTMAVGTGSGTTNPSVGAHTYNSGDMVPLGATPSDGFTFNNWTGDGDCADGSVTMNANKTCTANFTADSPPPGGGTPTITLTAPTGGNYTPSQSVNVVWTTTNPPADAAVTLFLIGDLAGNIGSVARRAGSSYNFPLSAVTTSDTYHFEAWLENGSRLVVATSIGANFTVTVGGGPPPGNRVLTIWFTPVGAAASISPPIGPNVYSYLETVRLNATANDGYTFTGWTGDNADCSDGDNLVTMDVSKTCTANFSLANINIAPVVSAGLDQTITLPDDTASLNGTVTDDGLPNPPGTVTTIWSKVSGPGTVSFANMSAVDTIATFSTAGAYSLRLTADDGEFARFDDIIITINSPLPTHFTLSVINDGGGTATSSPAGINCSADCSEIYDSGTIVRLTAEADPGFTFAGWSGACTGVCNVTMDGDKTVTAKFDEISSCADTGLGWQAPLYLLTQCDGSNSFDPGCYLPVNISSSFQSKNTCFSLGSPTTDGLLVDAGVYIRRVLKLPFGLTPGQLNDKIGDVLTLTDITTPTGVLDGTAIWGATCVNASVGIQADDTLWKTATAFCPANYKVTSGGIKLLSSPTTGSIYTESYPAASAEAWVGRLRESGLGATVYARCCR
jgi:uncharacterized repeat protein (TIGR02543 family)